MSDGKHSKYDVSPDRYRRLKRQGRITGNPIWMANREDMHNWSWTQYIVPVICGIMFIFVVCLFYNILGM